MDAASKARAGRVIRAVASKGWASGDSEIDTDWHDRAVRLVRLVAAEQGTGDEALALATGMLEDLEAVEGS